MGFKGIVIKKSNILMLKLGFSHRVVFLNTSDVKFYYKGKTQFTIESRDYLYLTNILFSFKMLKKINAYIKKGIYIKGELYTFKFSSKKSKF
jgi:ribosomal protein L6P/L9E